MSEETNYTTSESLELPSKGLIYGTPFSPQSTIRSMTTREEMKRLSSTTTPYKNLSDIIEACLITKFPVHVYDMCLGDYEYLLHRMRIVSHGTNYRMTVTCPSCGKPFDASVDLSSLNVVDYKLEDFTNLLHMHLSKSNKDITLKYETPRMLDIIALKVDELRKKSQDYDTNFELLVTLENVIDTVDGVKLNYVDQENFINTLPVSDMNKILYQIKKINKEVGLKTDNIQVKCSNCGYEVSTFFRFGPEFFRPFED